jgi:hypothetical protein
MIKYKRWQIKSIGLFLVDKPKNKLNNEKRQTFLYFSNGMPSDIVVQ